MWDRDKAVEYLNGHANRVAQHHTFSLGRCAEYVRKAVEAGGVKLRHHRSAKDYGSSLRSVGFRCMGQTAAFACAGDVAVIQPIPGHPHGHMAMFNGTIWISDFEQYHGLYPGSHYRIRKPPYCIYSYQTGMVL